MPLKTNSKTAQQLKHHNKMKTFKFLAILLVILTGTLSLRAQSAKPTIIFVHGIWADGSSFAAQIEALQAKGYPVESVSKSNYFFSR